MSQILHALMSINQLKASRETITGVIRLYIQHYNNLYEKYVTIFVRDGKGKNFTIYINNNNM